MIETGVTPRQLISELARSPHGKLAEYVPMGQRAATEQPEFLAHLIAWNQRKGQVRDSKVALPVVSLSVAAFNDPEFVSNSLGHLAMLGPRELLNAVRFALEIRLPQRMRMLRRLVQHYNEHRAQNWPKYERMVLQHRATLRELYALVDVKLSEAANVIIHHRTLGKVSCKPPKGSIFDVVERLSEMSPLEAAGNILELKIPYLIAQGALKKKAQEPDVLMALINRMTPTELVNNANMLKKWGIEKNPALRAAFQEALTKAEKSTANVLKTSRAVEAVGEDTAMAEKLKAVQEKQIDKLGGIEGDWLVLGDKSGSMTTAIAVARQVAAVLAASVKGKVYLVFFDSGPRAFDVTGKTFEQVTALTRRVEASGGTSIGCGLQHVLDAKLEFDGVAVVSDGGENTPPYFVNVYGQYCKLVDKEIPIYFYKTEGDRDEFSGMLERAGLEAQLFDLRGSKLDYYSVSNLVTTMRTARYGLVEEILATPLVKYEEVLPV
jgi:hypothetical protein